jgi:hypothetical protein
MQSTIFCVVTLRSPARVRRFGRTNSHYFKGERVIQIRIKQEAGYKLNGVTTQNIVIYKNIYVLPQNEERITKCVIFWGKIVIFVVPASIIWKIPQAFYLYLLIAWWSTSWQWRWKYYVLPKYWHTSTKIHGVIFQDIGLDVTSYTMIFFKKNQIYFL